MRKYLSTLPDDQYDDSDDDDEYKYDDDYNVGTNHGTSS